ncbi:hypothetical protein [Acidicapsa ligni]|uniref:hypothetical protein n=1 Tax=Acidicapsa ligni TaxID=542300 RepID=UPI0021E0AB43|nr:hypothetical protein [Acidicapsa ligni]
MTYEINVSSIPQESFRLLIRTGAASSCTGKTPQWVTDIVANGVELYLEDVMTQAGRHFADRVNSQAITGGTPRQRAMALAWAIGAMVNPYVDGDLLYVEDPGDPDVKRLCSEIFGVGLGLEMLRVAQVIDARTLFKVASRFDFEAYGPSGGRLVRIEAKGTFNNASSSRQRVSIAAKIQALAEPKRYDRAIGLISSLWTVDRQRIFDIEITDPERGARDHFDEATRQVIRFYARRFDDAVGKREGSELLMQVADDPQLMQNHSQTLDDLFGTDARPSRRFWRAQLTTIYDGKRQRFLGSFWERSILPIPLSLDARDDENVQAYMAVDARILELIRARDFRGLLDYKPLYSGILKAEGDQFRAIFHLDSYGILRGLVTGELPLSVDLSPGKA